LTDTGGARERMHELTVEVVRTIDQVDAATWDDLCRGQSFVNHRWLRLAENILSGHEPRYVLVRRQGQLEAAAICSIGRRFGNRALQRRLGWVLRPFGWLRCAVPLSSETGIRVRPGSPRTQPVQVLLGAMRRLMLQERALLSTVDFSTDRGLWADLQRGGFRQHSHWADQVLPISWPTLDAYVAHLPGPHRREIGRLRRRAEREVIGVEPLRAPESHATRVRALIGEVLQRHGTQDIYVADLVGRGTAILGDDVHVLAARRRGELIGCAVLLRDGDALLAKWIGLDYARSWGTATYQMLMLESIRLAIELGMSRLVLGPTSGAIKRSFGAVPHERFSAMAVMRPVPASLVGRAARLVAGRAAVDPTYSSATPPALSRA